MRLVLAVVVLACLIAGAYAPPPSSGGRKSSLQSQKVELVVKPSKTKFGPVDLKAGSGSLSLKFEWSTTDNFSGWSVLMVAKDTEQPIYRRVFGDVSDESFWKPTTKISALTSKDIDAALGEVSKNRELSEVATDVTACLKALKEAMGVRGEGPSKEGGKSLEVASEQSAADKKQQASLDAELGITRADDASLQKAGNQQRALALFSVKKTTVDSPAPAAGLVFLEAARRSRSRVRAGISGSSSQSSSDSSSTSSSSSGSSSGSSSDSGRSVDHSVNRPMRHDAPAIGDAANVYFGYIECVGEAFGTVGRWLGLQHSATRVTAFAHPSNQFLSTADYSNHGRACGDPGIQVAACSQGGMRFGRVVAAANVPTRWTCTTPYFVHVCNSDTRFQETTVRDPANQPSTWRGMCASVYTRAPGCI